MAKRKLRVGFVSIEDCSSLRSWSGIPANILRVFRSRTDLEVELISPLGTYFKVLYAPMKVMAKLTKSRSDWQRERGSLCYFAARVSRAFRQKKLDVIFSTSSIPGTRVKPEIPVIFWTDATIHGLEKYYGVNLSARARRLTYEQEEAALRNVAFACYASEWAAASARQFAAPDHVKVLPFGANLKIEHTQADVQRWIAERRAARPRGCNLLLVGVNWERKGAEIAVHAARQLNGAGIDARLRIVGCTPAGPVPDFVDMVGFIDKSTPGGQTKLAELYRESDIFILPSRAEAFGVAAVEAAAFGVPALVSATGGLSETVREGATGFRVPLEDDGTLFAEKAKAMMADYATFAMNAYAEYADRMNWETSIDHLVQFMRRAAGI